MSSLRSRCVELALVGGVTPLLFPLSWLARRALGLQPSEYAAGFLTFYAAYVINDPHFAVTYLLFYKDARSRALGRAFAPLQRARYWLAGLVVPLGLGAWATAALSSGSARALGWMMELMFFLVGWHYVKQAFGVLAVLSGRRGVRLSGAERVAVLVHAFSGWAYAWASPSAASREVEEKGVVYTALAHPRALEVGTGALFALSAAFLVLVLAHGWAKERRLPPMGPLLAFLVTVWLLTVYSSLDPLVLYFVPALHSLQYLYFVWLLRRNEARAGEGPREEADLEGGATFGPTVGARLAVLAASALGLGWVLFHGLPGFVDAARARTPGADLGGDLGATPYAAALFAFVNIHHYFMDHVIWRRENPDSRFLLDA